MSLFFLASVVFCASASRAFLAAPSAIGAFVEVACCKRVTILANILKVAPLAPSVVHIILMRAEEKMRWIYAPHYVAAMENP